MRFAVSILSALLLALTGTAPARAHDLPMSAIDLEVRDEALLARVSVHSFDLAAELGPPAPEDSLLDREALPRLAAPIRSFVRERLHVEADGAALGPAVETLVASPEALTVTIVVRFPLERPAKSLKIEGLLFDAPGHVTLLDVRENGETVREEFFNADQRSVLVKLGVGREILPVVRRFVESGIHHIFIGPDHILFIVGLMLLGGSVGRLLEIVTGFTLAHSVTLTLATLGVLNPPARLIEPLIALSIVFVGLDNLTAKPERRDRRALLAFGFGFIHGFGFASVLREFGIPPKSVGWALFSFNAGVEIGQACIVLAVAPVLALLRAKSPAAARFVALAGSVSVAFAGAWWFVERVFFST